MTNRLKHLTLVLLATAVYTLCCSFVVVIDAGHGGKDPGAMGSITTEKKLNLDVSLKLAELIKSNCKDVDVYLTRKTDVFLTLQERANFVNKHNADLFICIHTNSAENKKSKGAETFTLGLSKLESNLSVAMRENAVMKLEDDYQTTYQGFDPNSPESYIMFEFMQDQYLDKSLQFAALVQQQFSEGLHRADRGVRQAGFWVLHKSACPSVLIEMGFISTPEEEQYMASDKGKSEIANAIFEAFQSYKSTLEQRSNLASSEVAASSIAAMTEDTEKQTKAQEKKADKQADKSTKTQSKPQTATKATNKPTTNSQKPTTNDQRPTANDQRPTTNDQRPTANDQQPTADKTAAAKPVFRVQIFSVKAPLKEGDPTMKGLKGCKYTKDGNYYKYTYGEESSYDKAAELKKTLQEKFKDCFVVAFLGDEQILVKEAIKLAETK